MKIRELLAVESIELNGTAAGKEEVLNAMVALMAKSGKINDVEIYRKGVLQEKKRGQPESEKELQFLTANQMQ